MCQQLSTVSAPVPYAQGLFSEAPCHPPSSTILELARLLPTTARKLQFAPGEGFAENAVVERINVLIEQRCALTIRLLTDPAAENDAAAEPSV